MVAPTGTSTAPTPRKPDSVVQRMGIGPVRFTVDDAIQMVERGILPEDATVELLDGEFVYRDRFDLRGSDIVEGVKHNFVVSALGELRAQVNTPARHLRTQSTLVCSETNAPIADAVVLRGVLVDYRERLPTADDAWCVVEVADASYERDVGEKLRGYASAGVAQYVIINLRNRTAEVYTEPDRAAGTYPPPRVIASGERVSLRVGEAEHFELTLSDVLP